MRDWRRDKLAFSVFALPATAWLVVFFTIPLVLIWVYSFADRGPQGQVIVALSLENYQRALEWIHLGIIWKSIWIAAITTVLCLALGFPLAMGIAFAPQRWKNPLLLLVILPFWTNLLIRTYAWIAVLRTRGFLNSGLEWVYDRIDGALGLIGLPDLLGPFQPLELLYNTPAVIIGLVYVNLPFLVLPLYATLEKLDKSYLEASLDLGASQWRTFVSVMTPLALPGIVSGTLLVFILSLGTYLTPDLLGGPDSEMIGNLIARQFGAARDWPFGSALSFLLLYAVFLFLWLRATVATRSKGVGV
ncbi:ABC transporter permease [Rhodospirillaceae bacterium SYSU D60014]|uniref:ABC transporter permease n=1 Tax=Virgifigura deserti TaxID=2268457 RepID=UPI000E6684F0